MGIILLRLLMRSDSPQEWLSFRGPGAAGVADGQRLPDVWHGAKGFQIKWKTEIPGLAHSSPIVWGDRIFVTTAVSSRPNATFKPGFYGDGTASDDLSVHRWQVISLDRKSGKILWTKTAFEGQPKERRQIHLCEFLACNQWPSCSRAVRLTGAVTHTTLRGSCSGRRIWGASMPALTMHRITSGERQVHRSFTRTR